MSVNPVNTLATANWNDNNPLNPSKQVQMIGKDEAARLRAATELPRFEYLPALEEIKRCSREDSFWFCPLWGKNRMGKSSLALTLAWYVYGGDWGLARDHFVYTLPDVMDRITTAMIEKEEIPYLNWDDAAVHGGKRTKSREAFFMSFSELFDAIGTVVHALSITCIRPDAVVPALRERYFGEILVEPRGYYRYVYYDWRLAYYLPAQPYFVKVWVEEGVFDEIPPEEYKIYKEERNRLLAIKAAEVNERLYNPALPPPKLNSIDREIMYRIADKKTPIRHDNLKQGLVNIGFEDSLIDLSVAKLESYNLALKKGNVWTITPRGEQAVEAARNPSKS